MNTKFIPFMLEREMGKWENEVKYNLSESGVHPMTMKELFADDTKALNEILNTSLNYAYANGNPDLREQIANLYPGSTPDDILVTTGAAQANYTSILTLLSPGDEILVMVPNYMQVWGAAQNLGANVKTFSLKEELGWGFDLDEFRDKVTNQTKLIAICNPNNPTGHIMTVEERTAVINAASKVGAWILSDEVYAGAEHNTEQVTPSLWGEYNRVLGIGSMSKAYGLPGLRIGWVVSNPETTEEIWARQDYITISATVLGNKLAAYALKPDVRNRIIDRTRRHVRSGYQNLQKWVDDHNDLFSLIPPQAAAIGFVHYNRKINSSEFVTRLREEQSTYDVPGDHFGMDRYLRISYGLADDYVNEGLRRIYQTFLSNK